MRQSLWLVAVMVAARACGTAGQTLPAAERPKVILFHFAREGVPVERYTIQVQSDGLGIYWEGQPDFDVQEAVGTQRITAGQETLTNIFAALPAVLAGRCETHMKNIAQTGRKTLLAGTSGSPSCVFNFSDDHTVNGAADSFEAIAETMHAGQRLAQEHRFDRLALDAEMDTLVEEVASHRAIEVQNIAPVLQAIADDERVIDRVRRKAARLVDGGAGTSGK